MFNNVNRFAECRLIGKLGRVLVLLSQKIRPKQHRSTDIDIDIWNVLQPLYGPLFFFIQALVQRVLLQLVRERHKALALLWSRWVAFGLILGVSREDG